MTSREMLGIVGLENVLNTEDASMFIHAKNVSVTD